MVETLLNSYNKLITYEELPEWCQDNKYIKQGYRNCNKNFLFYCKNLFKIHNETVNIWSHLISSGIFLYLIIYSNYYRIVGENFGDNLAMNLFLVSEFLCFFFSWIMHNFYPYSEKWCGVLTKCDYFGISLNILGFYTIFIYYAFYCHRTFQIIYYSVSYGLGMITIILNCFSRFSGIKYTRIRAIIFFTFTIFCLVPFFHRIIAETLENEVSFDIELEYSSLTGTLLALSLFIYITKIPERYFSVSYIFTSHQIFHIMSTSALLLFYFGLFKIYDEHKNFKCVDGKGFLFKII